MRTFINLLVTATVINAFVSFYHSPTPSSGHESRATLSQNRAQLQNAYAVSFNDSTSHILSGSISRIHQLRTSRTAMIRFINGATMSIALTNLVLENRQEALSALRYLNSYKDGWLLDMVVVKDALITLILHEINIWDTFLALSNIKQTNSGSTLKHNLKPTQLAIEKYNMAAERVKNSYKEILTNLRS